MLLQVRIHTVDRSDHLINYDMTLSDERLLCTEYVGYVPYVGSMRRT
jgi:hypothetical protein